MWVGVKPETVGLNVIIPFFLMLCFRDDGDDDDDDDDDDVCVIQSRTNFLCNLNVIQIQLFSSQAC